MDYVINIDKEDLFSVFMMWMSDEDIEKTLLKNPHYTKKEMWYHYLNLRKNLKKGTKIVLTNEYKNYAKHQPHTFRNWYEKGIQNKPCAYIQIKEWYEHNPVHNIEISNIKIYDENIHSNEEKVS
jgi:hypothetical protein